MRYPDGGDPTPAARAKREQARMQAGGVICAAGVMLSQVSRRLRVSRKSACTGSAGASLQVPQRRAAERDEDVVAT
ncbi:hypothetical protein ACIBQX_19220 [Nonomuraea sp. NPDC049714]|uniref:hypothetical protein n=1 Tax=Nonomuraea sp. NPDC049714 TaxID=3364357 RepID=UPI003792C0DC